MPTQSNEGSFTSPTITKEDHVDKLMETLEFYPFAYKGDENSYHGTVLFEITDFGPQKDTQYLKVDVKKGETSNPVSYSLLSVEEAPKVEHALWVTTDFDTFVKVNHRDIHPKSAILSGKVGVRGWKYNDVRTFCKSFEFQPWKWDEFYAMRQETKASNTNEHQAFPQEISEALEESLYPRAFLSKPALPFVSALPLPFGLGRNLNFALQRRTFHTRHPAFSSSFETEMPGLHFENTIPPPPSMISILRLSSISYFTSMFQFFQTKWSEKLSPADFNDSMDQFLFISD